MKKFLKSLVNVVLVHDDTRENIESRCSCDMGFAAGVISGISMENESGLVVLSPLFSEVTRIALYLAIFTAS